MVHRQPPGVPRATSPPATAPAAGGAVLLSIVTPRAAAPRCSATCSTRASSCRPTASARCRATTGTTPTCCAVDGVEHRVDYEPAESTHRALRRQLELARAGLVPGQLPADRVAAEVPPLLRRRPQGRVPDRLRPAAEPRGRSPPSCRAGSPALFLRGPDGRRPVYGGDRDLPARPALARPHPRSTSTSTATTAPASAPATRRAGPAWWPSSSSRAASKIGDPMATPYDVIIIGTGAGGGTLAYRLAPTGKRILLLKRGDYVPREKQNWDSHAVVVEAATTSRSRGSTRTGKEFHRRHALLRRRQHEVLRRGAPPPAARRTSARSATTAASRRPGRSPTTTSSRTTPQAEHLYQVHGQRGDRSDRAAGQRAVPLSAAQPRAAHPAAGRRPARGSGTSRSRCRSASCSTSRSPAEPVHPLRHLRRLSVPRQRQGRRPGDRASIRPCSIPT